MAELRVRTIDESELDTVLAPDIEFEGTIEFSEPLLVKGAVRGEIKTESDLFIADSARLQANISAARVSVKGIVQGDIAASERVELFSGAAIVGNVSSPDLIIQSGSHYTGYCAMPGGPGAADAGASSRSRGNGANDSAADGDAADGPGATGDDGAQHDTDTDNGDRSDA